MLTLTVMLGSLIVATPAQAHPHFRFSYQIEPMLGPQGLTGLRVHWWIDPIASAQIRAAADVNGDGRLDANELAAFARGNQLLLAPQRYFLSVDGPEPGQPLAFEIAEPLSAEDDGGVAIRLRFGLRLTAALPGGALGGALGLRFFDPTWNVALVPHAEVLLASALPGALPKPQPDPLPGALPVASPHTPSTTPLACQTEVRNEALSTVGWGLQRVEKLMLHCAPAGSIRPQAHVSNIHRIRTEERFR